MIRGGGELVGELPPTPGLETAPIGGGSRSSAFAIEQKPVQNQDLWEELDEQVSRHHVHWTWTKGHADHEDNNRADELATQAAREQL